MSANKRPHYSFCKASIGFNRAALMAGYTPKIIPQSRAATTVINTELSRMAIFKSNATQAIPTANNVRAIPIPQPSRDKKEDSNKNSKTISRFAAPMDFLIPISRVFSPTEISITVINAKSGHQKRYPADHAQHRCNNRYFQRNNGKKPNFHLYRGCHYGKYLAERRVLL